MGFLSEVRGKKERKAKWTCLLINNYEIFVQFFILFLLYDKGITLNFLLILTELRNYKTMPNVKYYQMKQCHLGKGLSYFG